VLCLAPPFNGAKMLAKTILLSQTRMFWLFFIQFYLRVTYWAPVELLQCSKSATTWATPCEVGRWYFLSWLLRFAWPLLECHLVSYTCLSINALNNRVYINKNFLSSKFDHCTDVCLCFKSTRLPLVGTLLMVVRQDCYFQPDTTITPMVTRAPGPYKLPIFVLFP
jgi:hypothetical protein